MSAFIRPEHALQSFPANHTRTAPYGAVRYGLGAPRGLRWFAGRPTCPAARRCGQPPGWSPSLWGVRGPTPVGVRPRARMFAHRAGPGKGLPSDTYHMVVLVRPSPVFAHCGTCAGQIQTSCSDLGSIYATTRPGPCPTACRPSGTVPSYGRAAVHTQPLACLESMILAHRQTPAYRQCLVINGVSPTAWR